MPSPYQLAAQPLRDMGYSVIPLRARQKFPLIEKWSAYCETAASEETHAIWHGWADANIGLCLGSASRLTALDFDDDVDGLHAAILKIVGESPVRKAGKRGYTAFYRYGNERSASYRANSVAVLDVLATGRQTVLPPSLHPDGMAYRWLTTATLENTPHDKLPEIDAGAMAKVMKLFRSEQPVVKPAYRVHPFDYDNERDVAEALRCISPDCGYAQWVQIGMAIKDKYGEKGYNMWDAWSAASPKYEGMQKARKIWDSFNGQGIHIGTLFHHAINSGYRRAEPELVKFAKGGNLNVSVTSPVKSLSEEPVKTVKTVQGIPEDVFYNKVSQKEIEAILDAPGLPGRIASYINQTALYRQPVLALGAGLALAGTLMANKVESPTGLRTNIYSLGIAESGGGKDWPRKACKYLLHRAELVACEMGEPKSGSGLLTGLKNAGNAGLILIDEFGLYMQAMAGKNAAAHQKEIARYMMELYTSAGQVFLGAEYANKDGKTPRQSIVNPCLSMFPTTTPDNFYGALSGREVVDGFLARFLIFEADRFPIMAQEKKRELDDIPSDLWQEIGYWKTAKVNNDPGSNMGEYHNKPETVKFTQSATEMFREFSIANRMKAAMGEARNLASIYARINENALKIALVSHSGGEVDSKTAAWSIRLAEFCAAQLIKAVKENIGDNEQERMVKRLLKAIAELEDTHPNGAPHSVLLRKTRMLDSRSRRDVLDDLMKSGDIEKYQESAEGHKGPVPAYYRVVKAA